jgi:undecaprenyl-diphosphatase
VLEALQTADLRISLFINSFLGSSPGFDAFVHILERNSLFKGLVVMMLFWGLWFSANRESRLFQARLLSVLVVSVLAVFAGRGLATLMPYRPRPIHDPELGFRLLPGLSNETLDGWSSMPSDHAVLYFAIATGFFLAHRAVGVAALLHAALIICLPRIYFGLHYTSDVLVGAAIGVGMAVLLVPLLTRGFLRLDVTTLAKSHATLFYPLVFFATWQIASMFGPLRDLLHSLAAMFI